MVGVVPIGPQYPSDMATGEGCPEFFVIPEFLREGRRAQQTIALLLPTTRALAGAVVLGKPCATGAETWSIALHRLPVSVDAEATECSTLSNV